MPYFLLFAAGVLLGTKWSKVKASLVPIVGDAAAKFDAMYAQTAQKVGQRVEDLEDFWAETRHRANGTPSDSGAND